MTTNDTAETTNSTPTAYIALYGVDAETITDALSEETIGSINTLLHREYGETHDIPLDSVGLVTGERADALKRADDEARQSTTDS